MKWLKLFEEFDESNLKKFLTEMYGNLKRSYVDLDQETKDKLNLLVDELYLLPTSEINQFKSKLGKYRNSWLDTITYLEDFIQNNKSQLANNLSDSLYLIASKSGVYLYSFASYQAWVDFLDANKSLYKEIKWPFNPQLTGNAEEFFNRYLEKYPIFCLIIDTNKNEIYGASLNQSGEVGVFASKSSQPQKNDLFSEYLDKLNLTIEDL